jgi:16S rRNA (uracil1498-N3)-methyltransferase
MRFFEQITNDSGEIFSIFGENAAHISKSLRMKPGEELVLCDNGIDYLCEIAQVYKDSVALFVKSKSPNKTEPTVSVTLFQGYPKGDKLETIIQKSVELGADEIVPVVTSRSISRPDKKSAEKKGARFSKIAKEASGQSGRGKVIPVAPQINFNECLKQLSEFDLVLLCYEGGGEKFSKTGISSAKKIAVLIGPEGGFEKSEVEAAKAAGAKIVTLGPRIMRTETAPLAALSVVMYESGNFDGNTD